MKLLNNINKNIIKLLILFDDFKKKYIYNIDSFNSLIFKQNAL